jgi:hypothetical protein
MPSSRRAGAKFEEHAMMESTRTGSVAVTHESSSSAVSWGAVIAGGVAAAALTLVLIAFGVGMGFSAISPWPGEGVSATTFKIVAGIYLVITALMSSAVGGYLAGRLRTKWAGVNANAVFFRDTAHGFLAWAFATVLGAAVLGGAATQIASGGLQGLTQAAGQSAAQAAGPADLFVDRLLRPAPGRVAPAQGAADRATADRDTRGEFVRLIAASLRDGSDISAADRTYLAQAVAARTGLTPAEAEQRVAAIATEAKAAADQARKAAAQFSLWLAAAMVIGAFAASLAAMEGGQLRDGVWRGTKVFAN